MFSHIMIGADDVSAAKTFYDAALAPLGVAPGEIDGKGRAVYATATGRLIVTKPINGEAACGANGGTIGFLCKTPAEADAWHAAGLAHGGTACEDPPGPREGSPYYLAYLLDPSGNKLCALHVLG